MTNLLDIVGTIRGILKDACMQATTDLQTQSIYWILANLSNLEEQIILRELEEAAAEIQPLSAALQTTIDRLNGIILDCFIQQLKDIARENNLEADQNKEARHQVAAVQPDPDKNAAPNGSTEASVCNEDLSGSSRCCRVGARAGLADSSMALRTYTNRSTQWNRGRTLTSKTAADG